MAAATFSKQEIADFTSAGFDVSFDETPRRLIIGSQGLERTGKTDWVLRTAPTPIIGIFLDPGKEGVIEKYQGKRLIAQTTINVPPVATQDLYLKYWLQVEKTIKAAVEHPKVRTVLLDSGSDVWELLRLAEFGKLNQVGDIKKLYPQINQAYRSVIKQAYDREINFIVTHKVKKLYQTKTVQTQKGPAETEYWDGVSYERAGFGEGSYLVQCQVEHVFDIERTKGKGKKLSDGFGIRILDCRQRMELAGTELWGEENNFQTLAQAVFPDSSDSDWI